MLTKKRGGTAQFKSSENNYAQIHFIPEWTRSLVAALNFTDYVFVHTFQLFLENMARKLVQDDKELLQISLMELKKLQRQYRIMEGDENSYASEIKGFINKQRLQHFHFFQNSSQYCPHSKRAYYHFASESLHLLPCRKIIAILSNEENNLLVKLSTSRPTSAPELTCRWEKSYRELLKTYEKYLFLMKSKKDVISKLERKIRALEGESKVISYYGDGKAIQVDANVGRTEKQVELLQNKLYHVSK